jgi:hypothetical protein
MLRSTLAAYNKLQRNEELSIAVRAYTAGLRMGLRPRRQ